MTENGCREFCLVVEFFNLGNVGHDSLEMFQSIFNKSLNLISKNVESNVTENFDAVSLFLCMHIVRRYKAVCGEDKAVNALDKYWDGISILLRHRLNSLLKMNIQSVRDCDVAKIKTVDQVGLFSLVASTEVFESNGSVGDIHFVRYFYFFMENYNLVIGKMSTNPKNAVRWTPLKPATLDQPKVAVLTGVSKVMGGLVVTLYTPAKSGCTVLTDVWL